MKALFEIPGVDLRTRPEDIFDYLTHGVVPGPETVYRGIRRVQPAPGRSPDGPSTKLLRIPVKPITRSGMKPITESGQGDHHSERSDAGR